MLEIFPDFAVAGAQLETSLKGWSLQQNAEVTWQLWIMVDYGKDEKRMSLLNK